MRNSMPPTLVWCPEAGGVTLTRPVRESDVLERVKVVCALRGVHVRRQNTGAMRNRDGRLVRFGRKGDSDLTGIIGRGRLRGIAIAIEVKRPGEWPSPHQVGRMIEVNDWGAVAFWVDDADECDRVLRRVVEDGCRVLVHGDGGQELVDPEG